MNLIVIIIIYCFNQRRVARSSTLLQDLPLNWQHKSSISHILESANILKSITKSAGVIVYMVDSVKNEIYLPESEHEMYSPQVSWKIQKGTTAAAFVAHEKVMVVVNSLVVENRFKGFDWKGLDITGIMCIPVLAEDKTCFAVIELFRRDGMDYEEVCCIEVDFKNSIYFYYPCLIYF